MIRPYNKNLNKNNQALILNYLGIVNIIAPICYFEISIGQH